MIDKNKHQLQIINVITDIILIVASYFIAIWLRYYVFNGILTVNPFEIRYICCIIIISVLMALMYQVFHSEYFAILVVTAVGTLTVMALFFAFKVFFFSRWSLILFFFIASFLVIIKHAVGRKLLSDVRILGRGSKAIAVAGEGLLAEQYKEEVQQRFPAYKIVPFDYQTDIDEIVVALEPKDLDKMPDILRFADKEGLGISLIPYFNKYIPVHPEIESLGKSKLINLRATPLDGIGSAFIKRFGDIILSALMIVLLSPLLLVVTILIKITSPGPALFKQERIGMGKKPFVMYKFRSMRVNEKEKTGWSTDSDSRRTKFGSFIR